MRSTFLLGIGIVMLLACVVAAEDGLEKGDTSSGLDDRTFEALLDHVLPDPVETDYESIRWRARFHEAVTEATERRMPVLLWAMNGHPLGCT